MGARGPAPTPTKVLKARGSWRAKLRTGEPALPVERPTCPAWLSKEAKAEWRRQIVQLERMGVVARIDRPLLAAYCEAWSEFVQASEVLETNGYTFRTENGYVGVSPWVGVKNKAVERMVRIAAQFGFSPSARARLNAPQQEQTSDDNGKARFFNAG